MSKRETSAEINANAADWVARMDGAALDANAQAELNVWLAADVRRVGAFARAQAMLTLAQRTKALGTHFDPESFSARQPQRKSDEGAIGRESAVAERFPDRRRFLVGGAATVLAGVAATVGLSWQAAAHTISTRRGEIRTTALSDGSSITLNTDSSVRLRFSDDERRVDLISGEALFDIAHDAARAFIVCADNTMFKGNRGSFSVRKISGDIQLLVREGDVELCNSEQPRQPGPHVPANAAASISQGHGQPQIRAVGPSEVNRKLSWRDGVLSFEDETLDAAAKEFARYSDQRIGFADPGIGRETVTGLYSASNPAGFARSTALSLGLRAHIESDRIILDR